MITKEKHYKSEPAPRINEDRRQLVKMPNGNVDMKNNLEKNENGEQVIINDVTKVTVDGLRDAAGDDAAAAAAGQKVGTVIPNRIFVGGFSVKTADDDLWRFFSTISNITGAKIIYDRSGLSKCYGFVTFVNPRDAKYIVKQTGGVMFSPMGRLRISQAVRKQMPHFPPPSDYNTNPGQVQVAPHNNEGYYNNHRPNPNKSICIGYPMPMHPFPTMPQHGYTAPAINNHNGVSMHTNVPPPILMQPRSAPSTSPRSSTTGSSESGIYSAQSQVTSYQETVYPTMIAQPPPTYVFPGMVPYGPSLPAYDATGLYTTCPGYAQPVPAYPYVMLPPPPPTREGAPAYGPSYGPPPYAYVQQPQACYVRGDANGKVQQVPPPQHYPMVQTMSSCMY